MTDETANPNILATRLAADRDAPRRPRVPIDCGHFDIRISRDGMWHYRGSPITRKPLVTLFSSVLERDEDGQFWLATPVERGRIDVDDAPFTAVEMMVTGAGVDQRLEFRTNLDEVVVAGPDNRLRVSINEATCEPSPYIHLHDGLDALIVRAIYYDLVALGVDGSGANADLFGVWSDGVFFALGAIPRDD